MTKKVIALFALFVSVVSLQAQTKVTVTLDYGAERATETHQVDWYEGMTAMTALQGCATIETYPVKKYIFVTTINGVKNIRGEKAWYYRVNDKNPHKLAYLFPLKEGDVVRWVYKEDVCSATVDKKCEK